MAKKKKVTTIPVFVPDEKMNYHILCKGKRIASFVTSSDRDVAIEALEEYFNGAEFEPKDTVETI